MIVAVTGVVLIAFALGQLLGNLQIFLGPNWVNAYAEHLRELGPLLWIIRAFLLVNALVHIFFTISLALVDPYDGLGNGPTDYQRGNGTRRQAHRLDTESYALSR
jgi:succinate dehydrogenase/fumarate reductase cytochrome b subunit